MKYKDFKPVSLSDFLKKDFPPSEKVIDPFFATNSINMLHSPSGEGKTHFSLALALSVATGKDFLEWKIKKKRTVLYIDGELPGADFQESYLKLQMKALGIKTVPDNFFILADSLVPEKLNDIPKIDNEEGQKHYEKAIKETNADFIIFDSITFFIEGGEEATNFFTGIQTWLKKIRNEGRTILLIHHDNTAGKMYGKNTKERVLATRIHAKPAKAKRNTDGIILEISFPKGRGMEPKEKAPVEISFKDSKWKRSVHEQTLHEKFVEFCLQGDKIKREELAEYYGVSGPNLLKHFKRAVKNGELKRSQCPWATKRRSSSKIKRQT